VSAKAEQLRDRLDVLEAERLVLTIELRNELLKAAKALMPEAIAQARGQAPSSRKPGRPGNPALLRLISRMAMRNVHLEARPKP
jgi:hypothetical protein